MAKKVKAFFDIDINQFFINPFDLKPTKIEPPFETLTNPLDKKIVDTNFVVDFALLDYMLQFTSNVEAERDKNVLHIYLQRKLPDLNIKFNEKQGYNITKVFPYLVFKIDLFRRTMFKELPANHDILQMDQRHQYVANIANVTVDNTAFGEQFHFEDKSEEELKKFKILLLEYSHILWNLICDVKRYPKYEIKENKTSIIFPPKADNKWVKAGKDYVKIKS